VASNILVKRLAIIFGEPKTEDPEGFLFEYANAFKGIPTHILDSAADVIIKQRKYRSWPTVAECLEAVDMAQRQTVAKGKMLDPIKNFETWYEDRLERIRKATTRSEMQDVLDEIRPYDAARWIMPSRMRVALETMEKRCQELFGGETLTIASRRMTGDSQ
jgi:hypothetical protein